eukprot:Colp12_sorted_trinity150504_noHs@6440
MSQDRRTIYLALAEEPQKVHEVEFGVTDTAQDVYQVLTSTALKELSTPLRLKKPNGTAIPINSHIPPNTKETPYLLESATPAWQGILNTLVKDVEALKEQQKQYAQQMKDVNRSMGRNMGNIRLAPLEKPLPKFSEVARYTFSEEVKQELKRPTFDNWMWEDGEMSNLMELMFYELGLVKEFNINPITLRYFLRRVRENYNDNPFHNFRHSFCVTQMMYGMIHLTELWTILSPLEILVCIVSAICHDLDHPGKTNSFQINARTELAIRYNNQSVLENHHAAMTFYLLNEPKCNIFENIPEDVYMKLREGIIDVVLITDMAKHGEFMSALKRLTESEKPDLTTPENKRLIMKMFMKCSDISNEARPMDVSEKWADCLLEEFFAQSDYEKAAGLPVLPFMDREKVTKAGAQVGFISFVLLPLFEQASLLFPCLNEPLVEPIRKAKEHYLNMQKAT